MPELPGIYQTATPAPKFYTETLTLTEHQLLKRIRQLCKRGGTVVLLIEIVNRDEIKTDTALRRLEE